MIEVIITCEHGGNDIPNKYSGLFENAQLELMTHEGSDIGALKVAEEFANFFPHFYYSQISRLLIELNRSPGHPKLFSRFSSNLPLSEKERILTDFYYPYRSSIITKITQLIEAKQQVVHLSVHSFTPILNSQSRKSDIGLLYDPSRCCEKIFCCAWQLNLSSTAPNFKVRRNYPYLGKSDGFVTFLRKKFDQYQYIGIELEINQGILTDKNQQSAITHSLLATFKKTLTDFNCSLKGN